MVNVTKDEDGCYKALETLEMCRAIRYAGKVYHNHLARKCCELGYETRSHRDEKGRIVWFDLEGVSEEIMELYSKRRKEIEEQERKFIEEHGRKPTLAENNFLSMTTRESKMKTSDREKVRRLQLSQLRPEQLRELNQVVWTARNRGSITSPGDIALGVQIIREALPQLYERETVLRLDKVLAETLNRNLGRIDLQTLKNAVPEVSELRNLGGLPENPWFSPQEVIDRELYAIEAVENQQGNRSLRNFKPFLSRRAAGIRPGSSLPCFSRRTVIICFEEWPVPEKLRRCRNCAEASAAVDCSTSI